MRVAFAAAFASSFALCAFAEKAVKVELSASPEPDAKAIPMTVTVTNTGSEQLKLLKEPNSVLSDAKTETFALTSSNGSPSFKGIRMKYSPAYALKENNPSSFVVLEPGQSHSVTHELTDAYDFSRTGAGEYKIDALNALTYVDTSGQLSRLEATAKSATFKLTGNILQERNFRPRGSTRRPRQSGPSFQGCSDSQQADIKQANSEAEIYISDSIASLETSPSGSRYTSWFGADDSKRRSTVMEHFTSIQNKGANTSYDCSTCTEQDVYAYVYPDQIDPRTIYLCPAFWRAPATGTDSKAGTLVHEQSHFKDNGATRDHVYGQSRCRLLATAAPELAIMNADSHEYFAENNPQED